MWTRSNLNGKRSRSNVDSSALVVLLSSRRNKSGVWGMRNEKLENINGYQCRVYTANRFELVTRTRIEHMTPEDRKAYETGSGSSRNFLGGVFNFLESSASSSKSTTAAATTPTGASATKPLNVLQLDSLSPLIVDGMSFSFRIQRRTPINLPLPSKSTSTVEWT